MGGLRTLLRMHVYSCPRIHILLLNVSFCLIPQYCPFGTFYLDFCLHFMLLTWYIIKIQGYGFPTSGFGGSDGEGVDALRELICVLEILHIYSNEETSWEAPITAIEHGMRWTAEFSPQVNCLLPSTWSQARKFSPLPFVFKCITWLK